MKTTAQTPLSYAKKELGATFDELKALSKIEMDELKTYAEREMTVRGIPIKDK